jgi:hypothetical protein
LKNKKSANQHDRFLGGGGNKKKVMPLAYASEKELTVSKDSGQSLFIPTKWKNAREDDN